MKHSQTLAKLLVSLLILVLPLAVVGAQTDDDDDLSTTWFELVGTIESVDGTIITVNNMTFDVANALIDDDVQLEIGEMIDLYVAIESDVMTVFLVDDIDDEDDVDQLAEIKGLVDDIDGSSLTIGGITVDITGTDLMNIAVGDYLEVYATVTDGLWTATRAEIYMDDDDDDRDEDYELRGTLEERGDGFIVINGQTIDTTNADFDDDVAVGELVEVEFYMVDGTLIVLYVDDLDRDDDYDINVDNVPVGTETTISFADAAQIALEVYPNATVSEIELDIRYGDVLVWEIELSNGVEIYVDATTGVRIEIDLPGDDGDDDRRDDDDDDRDDNNRFDDNDWDDDDNDDDWDDDDNDDDWDDDDDDDDWDDDDD